MIKTNILFSNGKRNLVTILGILVFAYWIFTRQINIYHSGPIGAVFELLWLPMMLGLVLVPVISFVLWKKDKTPGGWLYMIPAVLPVVSLILLLTVYN